MQFGKTLPRLLQALAYANLKYGPVCVAKYNLSDGFYQLQLSLDSIVPLAVLLPTPPGEDLLVAPPLVVTIGWTEAPSSFCATTETATNFGKLVIVQGRGTGVPPFGATS